MDTIEGSSLIPFDSLDEQTELLEAQLRLLIDGFIQPQEIRDDSGSSSILNLLHNKSGLISALAEFIISRESKIIEEELRLPQILSPTSTCKVEAAMAELKTVSKERNSLKELKMLLESRIADLESENLNLRSTIKDGRIAATDGALNPDFEAYGQSIAEINRVEVNVQQQTSQLHEYRDLRSKLEAALEVLENDRIAGLETLDKLESQLHSAREIAVERENHISWLELSLKDAQTKAARNETFVRELRAELEAMNEQVASSEQILASNTELLTVLQADLKKYAESAVQLEAQLIAVQAEKEKSMLRIGQLEEELESTEMHVSITEKSAEELHTALHWATISDSVSPLAHMAEQSPVVQRAIARSASSDNIIQSRRMLSLDSDSDSETTPIYSNKTRLSIVSNATLEDEVDAESQSSSTVSDEEEDGEFDDMDQSQDILELLLRDEFDEDGVAEPAEKKMTVEELKRYAKAIQSDFVDVSKPASSQKACVSAFAKELVAKGAEEDWAREHIYESMERAGRKLKSSNHRRGTSF